MSYYIEYVVLCDKGMVRSKNQDNFWCMGKFLDSENEGLAEPIVNVAIAKDSPAFAVFDGMGGEQQGEAAAYIAAMSFNKAYEANSKKDIKRFLMGACDGMNDAICLHIDEHKLRRSGSTAAILMFGRNEIYVCNIGDSRVYRFSDDNLLQISHDHIEISGGNKKAPLTQSLGVFKTEFVIEPYLAKGAYENGDKYLICTDGLTDIVPEKEITKAMSENSSITNSAEALLKMALESGGKDNITIIVCEIQKQGLKILNKHSGGAAL